MLTILWVTSSILVTGMQRFPGGGPGPASSNADSFTAPRVNLSTREQVDHMWGKPASERVEKDHAICAWPRGGKTVILTFNTRLDLLVDMKVVKKAGGKPAS